MFKNLPKILGHVACVGTSNYVTNEFILHLNKSKIDLFRKFCPHKMYPLHEPGELVNEIHCKFHNFKWNIEGAPVNNNKKLTCGTAEIGRSGLILKDFIEPNHQWVADLANETKLVYSHCTTGKSDGSWLWLMDAEADYLHVYHGGIHEDLPNDINLSHVKFDNGDGWVIQMHDLNWWSLYIFPLTFIEYKPGCLAINLVTPEDINSEFKFTWLTQFYYDSGVPENERKKFETLEDVFIEDVRTIEKQKTKFFCISQPENKFEEHSFQFGLWVRKHLQR